MKFSQIPGNTNAKEHLLNAVRFDRISHAHLFAGEDGSSCLAIAWAFASFLLCEDKKEKDSCGQCSSCIKLNKLSHPDVHWVFPVTSGKGANPFSDMFIEEWREFLEFSAFPFEFDWSQKIGANNKQVFIGVKEAYELSKKMTLKSFEGSYRIIIVWQADKMHAPAANKLLKLLEEPPEKTIFLLTSSKKNQLLATIVSRIQNTDIISLSDTEMDLFLNNEFNLDPSSHQSIKLLSSGNIAKALKMANDDKNVDYLVELFQSWMRICYLAKIPELSTWVDQLTKTGREEQKEFINYCLHMARECLVFNFGSDDLQRLSQDEKVFAHKFAPFINENNAQSIIEELELAFSHISRNASSKIVLMDLSLKIVILLRAKSVNLQKSINQ
jgi:DNA polymerase-3 subunit delta'